MLLRFLPSDRCSTNPNTRGGTKPNVKMQQEINTHQDDKAMKSDTIELVPVTVIKGSLKVDHTATYLFAMCVRGCASG